MKERCGSTDRPRLWELVALEYLLAGLTTPLLGGRVAASGSGLMRQYTLPVQLEVSCSVQLIGKYHHGGHIIDSVAPIAANWPAVGYGATWGAGSIISPRPIADVAMTIQHLIGALYPAAMTSLVP
ncbi:hypothetical protein Pcinc_019038 [Petrolisthes cinctipes]|uniref:Uncharacterized protein n=1 Tax=Petrolisthes cinctipes TaxID=88211 RepID=A0AAE1KKY5_PETCI|nr:hypothetical protein Pcinc_019038 [Petrolisthes cinctipes]